MKKSFLSSIKFCKSNSCKGFTLAEILISLMVLGVIAAILIPSLIQKYQEHAMITALKKANSVFSNAYAQAIVNNGPPEDWINYGYRSHETAKDMFSKMAPFLNVSKTCDEEFDCFADSYKALFSNQFFFDFNTDNMDTTYGFVLTDGMSAYVGTNGDCTDNGSLSNTSPLNEICGDLWVDVNGKNPPNRVGVDTFVFRFTKSGQVLPFGLADDSNKLDTQCKYQDTSGVNGYSCAAWAIVNGNMDYLRRPVSWDE